ncbi:MAG TPA: hypothetical protein VKB41_14320 [Steroidobacteraceae bacterium]|jgi:hypothetical protein|nr:hypothetical protein [Steroidobacteraceae bacterium]
MSELEKARAGFVLSLLLFALGLVLLHREEPAKVSATAEQSVIVCAATKGALCEPVNESSVALQSDRARSEVPRLGAITVVAARLPNHLGEMLVQVPRYATELDGRLRLATARGAAETEIILAQ